MQEKAKGPHEFFHVLSEDEVHLKKNLVFSKRTGEMVGYVNLDPIEKELAEIDRLLEAKVDQVQVAPTARPPLADKLLCYMVQSVSKEVNIKSVVATFGTSNMTKESLYQKTWDVIAACELANAKIIIRSSSTVFSN